MNDNRKATEFSTHIFRSRMRRYLHGQLNAEETRQVEIHLANCAHCSASLVSYIEEEETDQYNTYAKQLSGKLKEQKIAKRSSLSSFQIKTIRAAAAVLTLVVFSFFGVKNIINKEVTSYQAEETGLPVKGKPVVATKKPVEKKVTTKPAEKKEDRRLAENRPAKKIAKRTPAVQPSASVKKKESAKKATPVAAKPRVKPEAKDNQPVTVNKKKAEVVPEKKEEKQQVKPVPEQKVANVEKIAESANNESKTDPQAEAKSETAKPLPEIKKMDAAKKVELSKPIGSTTPATIPVPGGRLR